MSEAETPSQVPLHVRPGVWYPFREWCAAKRFTVQHGYHLIADGKLETVTSGRRRYVTEAEDRRFDEACRAEGEVA